MCRDFVHMFLVLMLSERMCACSEVAFLHQKLSKQPKYELVKWLEVQVVAFSKFCVVGNRRIAKSLLANCTFASSV